MYVFSAPLQFHLEILNASAFNRKQQTQL